MINLLKLLFPFFIITNTVKAYNLDRQTSIDLTVWNAHISPEILNELKDFQNLIPAATIDEIVAKHLFIDGNFRTAFKYLYGQEFKQLQRQLLDLPEVIEVLDFLHLTTANATTSHTGATTVELVTTDASQASMESVNNYATTPTTTSPGSNIRTSNSIDGKEETFHNKKTVHRRRPHTSMQLNNIDDDIAISFNLKQPLVRIVLLEDSVAKTNSHNVTTASNDDHHLNNHQHSTRKYEHRFSNNYHHHHHEQHYQSLGTFTAFVEEVLQHLPHAAYQNMIKEKCQKNGQFAEFYQALRSQEFKLLVEQSMQTANIKKVIETLNSHDVDVVALKPIAFQVISWGPNI